tara:strand:- start:4868 stop:5476 length:609 start_codon:yes stop_codon:yes gene_type:complete
MDKNIEIELPRPEDVVVMDIEASSLRGTSKTVYDTDSTSYPVEIGIAHADGRTAAHLIKPEASWKDWNGEHSNEDKGRIHGISRRQLFEEGRDVRDVAGWLNDELTGKVVMCDSPEAKADTFWIDRLFQAAQVERTFDIQYLYDYIDLQDPDMGRAYDNTGLSREAPHRAGQDAADVMILYSEYYALKNSDDQRPDFDTPSF